MAENIIILEEEIGFEVEIFFEKCIVESGMDAFYTVASIYVSLICRRGVEYYVIYFRSLCGFSRVSYGSSKRWSKSSGTL
ncbi:hypothetical protein [Clostridium sp. FP1]|uniref:hypothetical protein n=1 Tax=Clostridium sp. FP1 TaxID=2724076 RepID=UPI001CCD8892|nr:hypothetical protein [Clostridium sp. FP1]MBZ9633866.1 hypothetical protein [Clostridium sp. FP1]